MPVAFTQIASIALQSDQILKFRLNFAVIYPEQHQVISRVSIVMSKPFGSGNAIMEYTIPILLFMGTIAVILNLFDINSHIAAWFNDAANVKESGGGKATLTVLGSDVNERNLGQTMAVCVNQNSLCVNLPAWMADEKPQTQEVAGSMGEEIAYAGSQALSDIAEQLAQQEDMDPAIISAIETLANLSHNRAEYLDKLATMADNLCPPDAVLCSTRRSTMSEGFKPDGQVFFTTQRNGEYVRVEKPRLQDYLSYDAIHSAENNSALSKMLELETSSMPSHWENDWYTYMDILNRHRFTSNQIEAETPTFKTPEAQQAYQQYLSATQKYYSEHDNENNNIENWQTDYKDLSGAQHAFHNLLKNNQDWLNRNYYNHANESVVAQTEAFVEENNQFQEALSTVETLAKNNPDLLNDGAWRLIYENAANVDHVYKTQVGDPTPVSVDIERTQTIEVEYNPNDICQQSQGGDCMRN